MKKIMFFLFAIAAIIPQVSNAGDIFSFEQRKDLMSNKIPKELAPVWNDPHIQECWISARNGSDESLAALFLIADSRKKIDKVAEKRGVALSSAKTPGEAYNNLKKSFNLSDLNMLKKAVEILPRSWKFCENLYEANQMNRE